MKTKIKKNDIRFRVSIDEKNECVFVCVITHPMETGFRKDRKTGKKIPAEWVNKFSVSVDGDEVINMDLSSNLSKNPLLGFDFTDEIKNGQLIQVTWLDSKAEKFSHSTVVNYDDKGRHNYKSFVD